MVFTDATPDTNIPKTMRSRGAWLQTSELAASAVEVFTRELALADHSNLETAERCASQRDRGLLLPSTLEPVDVLLGNL